MSSPVVLISLRYLLCLLGNNCGVSLQVAKFAWSNLWEQWSFTPSFTFSPQPKLSCWNYLFGKSLSSSSKYRPLIWGWAADSESSVILQEIEGICLPNPLTTPCPCFHKHGMIMMYVFLFALSVKIVLENTQAITWVIVPKLWWNNFLLQFVYKDFPTIFFNDTFAEKLQNQSQSIC